METIPINQVLSEIRASTANTAPFLLKVVVSTGRSRGSIRVLGQCLKGFPSKKETPKAETGQGKFLYKEHDTIPIIDLEDKSQFKTILISHIIGYKQYKVIH